LGERKVSYLKKKRGKRNYRSSAMEWPSLRGKKYPGWTILREEGGKVVSEEPGTSFQAYDGMGEDHLVLYGVKIR